MTATRALLRRDLLLAWRRIGDALNPLMFFTMVALVFPLAVTPEAAFMQKLAPGILWVAALLASLIGLGGLFTPDYLDGTLEQQALSPVPLGYIALLRVLSHWMVTGLPLVILTPVIAVPLGIPGQSLPAILLLLLPGTLAFSLLGAIGAALTVSLRSHGLLLPVLVLPLAVPVLIFGARGTLLAMGGDWPTGPLYMLAFLAALGASLGPLAMAGALRISLD
ncbi:MAG TPA: heme exporter protein CcmB [Gammaproteobacteria bacterium]|nr:heme exporter protein CcmB [Gammaproteobacteria bacterium]